MGEVVNLRLARKRAARAASDKAADANRIQHGLSKPERESARREAERVGRLLDGARREDPSKDGAAAGVDETA